MFSDGTNEVQTSDTIEYGTAIGFCGDGTVDA
jgi:hypothetical protein